jgi:hypothetical protein
MKREEGFALAFEPSFRFSLPHCLICGFVIFQSQWQVSDVTRLTRFAGGEHFDAPVVAEGTQVNQYAIRHKDPVNFTEGMDHARMGNSSE